jgi:hypothetical protein
MSSNKRLDVFGAKVPFRGAVSFGLYNTWTRLIAFQFEIVWPQKMAPVGNTMHTTQCRVIKGYRCSKLSNLVMKKKTLITKRQINCLVEKSSISFFLVSFHYLPAFLYVIILKSKAFLFSLKNTYLIDFIPA